MSIYDQIKALMAEADSEHRAVDQRFEERLKVLLGANGMAGDPPKPEVGDWVSLPPKRRNRGGGVRDAVEAVLSDRQTHKLADIMRETGKARGSIFNALTRMAARGEVEPLGDGLYRLARAEQEAAPAQAQFS